MRRRAVSLAVLACAVPLAGPADTVAAPAIPNAPGQARLDLTVRYLQDQQNQDGGWGGSTGRPSDPMFSAWLALGVAAGGVNPLDQRRPGGTDAMTYLAAHAGELKLTTDFERALLVVIAAGTPVHDFGGRDLVALILSRQLPDGSFAHEAGATGGGINDTAFAILALSTTDEPAVRTAIEAAADWLVRPGVQHDGGGWSYHPTASPSSDMTAAVIEALRAAGRADTDAERRGWDYLRASQVPSDGGFQQWPGEGESNTGSTAWTIQGMWAAGLEPATYSSPSPLDYLSAMQAPGGEIGWRISEPLRNPLWMTAYAAPAYAGYPLPIPTVPRADPAAGATTPPATSPDAGVTAGGGGNGAPLFSKPEPQSKGQTAGGVRRTNPTDEEAAPHASTKRRRATGDAGEARPTAASNGTADAGVTRDEASPAAATGTTPIPTPTPTPTPTAARSAGLAGASGSTGGGSGPGGVQGRVLGLPRAGADGSGDADSAAPGLRSARDGGSGPAAAGVLVLFALAVVTGMNLERQRTAVSP